MNSPTCRSFSLFFFCARRSSSSNVVDQPRWVVLTIKNIKGTRSKCNTAHFPRYETHLNIFWGLISPTGFRAFYFFFILLVRRRASLHRVGVAKKTVPYLSHFYKSFFISGGTPYLVSDSDQPEIFVPGISLVSTCVRCSFKGWLHY